MRFLRVQGGKCWRFEGLWKSSAGCFKQQTSVCEEFFLKKNNLRTLNESLQNSGQKASNDHVFFWQPPKR